MKTPAFPIKFDFRLEFLLDFLKYRFERIFKTNYSISRNISEVHSPNLTFTFYPKCCC